MKPPFITAVSFSAGTGSAALVWMLLRGELPRPKRIVIQAADPGLENHLTIAYRDHLLELLRSAGFFAEVVPGPNLYRDILALKSTGKTRFDTPPYFTKNADGTTGQLKQGCTKFYKIAPMRRHLRRHLWREWRIKNMRPGLVERWIGFTYDERHRVKPSKIAYEVMRYPLIEAKITKKDLLEWYAAANIAVPPRSVCNACFANRPEFYRDMAANRPQDFEQACAVDESVRDWTCIHVREQVYVSPTLLPLRILGQESAENPYDGIEDGCDSGYCFV